MNSLIKALEKLKWKTTGKKNIQVFNNEAIARNQGINDCKSEVRCAIIGLKTEIQQHQNFGVKSKVMIAIDAWLGVAE